jgi:hypothetical protein
MFVQQINNNHEDEDDDVVVEATVYQDLDDVETTWINLLAMWLELELMSMNIDDE